MANENSNKPGDEGAEEAPRADETPGPGGEEVRFSKRDEEPRFSPGELETFRTAQRILSRTPYAAKYRRIPKELLTQEFRELLDAVFEQIYYSDPNTKLPSRMRFDQRLKEIVEERQEIQKAGHEYDPCTIVYCDLNHFGECNAILSHDITDKLVKAIADVLRKETGFDDDPPACFLARAKKEGDEFLILINGIDKEKAEAKMQRVCDRLKDQPFKIPKVPLMDRDGKVKAVKNMSISGITMTYGCYELDSDLQPDQTCDTPEDAVKKADLIMDLEKKKAREDKNSLNTHENREITKANREVYERCKSTYRRWEDEDPEGNKREYITVPKTLPHIAIYDEQRKKPRMEKKPPIDLSSTPARGHTPLRGI